VQRRAVLSTVAHSVYVPYGEHYAGTIRSKRAFPSGSGTKSAERGQPLPYTPPAQSDAIRDSIRDGDSAEPGQGMRYRILASIFPEPACNPLVDLTERSRKHIASQDNCGTNQIQCIDNSITSYSGECHQKIVNIHLVI
jgi:hypothetical protein